MSQSKKDHNDIMNLSNDFFIEDIVYLKHDIEQKPRMILGIVISKHQILYEIISGTEISNHYGFEFSKDKIVY